MARNTRETEDPRHLIPGEKGKAFNIDFRAMLRKDIIPVWMRRPWTVRGNSRSRNSGAGAKHRWETGDPR